MPPRRSHKKSRAGCRRCKNRKIKCDEVHPRCGNCLKHGVGCDFENPDITDDFVMPTTTSATSSPPVPSPVNLSVPKTPSARYSPIPKPPLLNFADPPLLPSINDLPPRPADRLLELRLLHHYTTATAKTLLINSALAEDIWQRTVPQMAFDGKGYLLGAILSVAALHLRSQIPEDKSVIEASHAYAASTFSEYCAALDQGITPDNAEALFLTASLIAFQATASRIFAKDDVDADPNVASGRYALPLPWFHAFQGVKTVVATSWQWIHNSETVKAVIDSQPGFQLDLNPLRPGSFFGHLLDGMNEELARENQQQASYTAQAYYHAICVLNWAHKDPHPVAALAFPATVSRRYIDLVEAKRPRALAILACFFALLKRMEHIWWLQDVARREVMGLMGMFEPGSKWWNHIEWPIRIALWEGKTIPSERMGVEFDKEEPHQNGTEEESMMGHIEMLAQILNEAQEPRAVAARAESPLDAESPD